MTYGIAEAERELQPLLDRAPKGATYGEWTATTMQAGTSSRTGGYRDATGGIISDDDGPGEDFRHIETVIGKLEEDGTIRFNTAEIRWEKSKLPFMKGKVTIRLRYDADIVPRANDDQIYEDAARARLAYWKGRGTVAEGFAAERGEVNIYAQTKWFNPHRRVLHIRAGNEDLLATDGLSTPWAGISEKENGVECEVALGFPAGQLDAAGLALWADLMIGVGDLVADGYRVARDVERHGAILFCRTGDKYESLSRIILSKTDQVIPALPFGAVPLIRATAVAEADIASRDPDEEWGATAARAALTRRGITF